MEMDILTVRAFLLTWWIEWRFACTEVHNFKITERKTFDNLRHIAEGLNISSIQNVTMDYCVFGLCPSPGILKTQKNTTFRKLDLFPSSDEEWETPTLLDPLERANPSYFNNLSITRRTKSKNPVMLSVTHHRQNPSESMFCYTLLHFLAIRRYAAAGLWSSDRTPSLSAQDCRSKTNHKSQPLFIRVCCRGILHGCIQERVGFLASIIRADKGKCNYNWLCMNVAQPLFLFHVKQPSDSATIPPRSSSTGGDHTYRILIHFLYTVKFSMFNATCDQTG
jgi:hypothetical protein